MIFVKICIHPPPLFKYNLYTLLYTPIFYQEEREGKAQSWEKWYHRVHHKTFHIPRESISAGQFLSVLQSSGHISDEPESPTIVRDSKLFDEMGGAADKKKKKIDKSEKIM